MVDNKLSVENPANKQMHYGNQTLVGVFSPPDKLPNKEVFSATKEIVRFNQIQQDLFSAQRKATPKKKGTPKIIKIALGAVATWLTYVVVKEPIEKFLKKIFK